MARYGYIFHDSDREDQRREEQAERRNLRRAPVDVIDGPDLRLGGLNPDDEEFESVEAFAQYLLDDERESFTRFELFCLAIRQANDGAPLRNQQIRDSLAEYGLKLERRPMEREIRGFSDSPNTRWKGNPMAGGGGGGSIIGMVD